MTYYVGSQRSSLRFDSIEPARAYSIDEIEHGRAPSIYIGEKKLYYGKVRKTRNGEYRWTGLSKVTYRIDRDGRIIGKVNNKSSRRG